MGVQQIIHVPLSVEQYTEQRFHQQVRPPQRCGNCGKLGEFGALGYYSRYTTSAKGLVISFWVARFLCKACKKSTSCLPSFAQPYRLVASETIAAYVREDRQRPDVQRNEGLLARYRKCFLRWAPELLSIIGTRFGRGPPHETATAFWRRAVAVCGALAELTLRLVQEFRTTCFGTYRCHQPSCAH